MLSGGRPGPFPIGFVSVSDPLGSGLVESLSHPGENLTGFFNYEFSMGGKWLETLVEVVPRVKRVLALLSPANLGNEGLFRAVVEAAPAFRIEVVPAAVVGASGMERAIKAFGRDPDGGLLQLPGAGTEAGTGLIIEKAAHLRLPAIYTDLTLVPKGALLSYDTDTADLYRRAASYVDRILEGEKPGDLPVQAPNRYQLMINLKTAKALGLEVPANLLALADEVIEKECGASVHESGIGALRISPRCSIVSAIRA